MKRALVITSVASMIDQFNMTNIKILKDLGYETDVACNFIEGNNCSDERVGILKNNLEELGVKYYQIDFARNVTKVGQHFKSLSEIKKLLNTNHYDLIHCQSPIGGMLTRVAAKKHRSSGTKIIYTAHGFHFYKGAPKLNWLIYYPIEKICSKWTDVLITINKEDFDFAKTHMHTNDIQYVPGIGIDVDRFANKNDSESQALRQELNIPKDAVVFLSVGELNENKNHKVVIDALAGSSDIYLIAGIGNLKEELVRYAKEKNVDLRLLGFRDDVPKLLHMADFYIHPSIREGLPVALMEALASGITCISSDIRGSRDLTDNTFANVEELKQKIKECKEWHHETKLREEFSKESVERVLKDIYGS